MRRGQEPFEAFKAAVAGPAIVLALALIPLVLIPVIFEVSTSAKVALEATAWIIWGLFVVEYLVLLWLAPDRRMMIRTHLFELS